MANFINKRAMATSEAVTGDGDLADVAAESRRNLAGPSALIHRPLKDGRTLRAAL